METEVKKLEDILREQVREMEKLLEIKNRRIVELEGYRNNSITVPSQPYIYNPCTCRAGGSSGIITITSGAQG